MTSLVERHRRTQDQLQAEAETVMEDLQLAAATSSVGNLVRVGSAALGLMVWRDLDITVICPTLNTAAVARIGAVVAEHLRVREVVFRDDTGEWNSDPNYPDGLYLGVRYRSSSGHDWRIDVWFVDDPERQPDLAHIKTYPQRLTADTRDAILDIKTAWFNRSEYGSRVRSHDIYTAVLDAGVKTRADFDAWLMQKGSA